MIRVNKIDEQFLAAQIIAGKEYAFDFIFRKYYRLWVYDKTHDLQKK